MRRLSGVAVALSFVLPGHMAVRAEAPAAAPAAAVESDSPSARLEAARKLVELMGIEQVLRTSYRDLGPAMALASLGAMSAMPETAAVLAQLDQRVEGGRQRLLELIAEEATRGMSVQIPGLLEEIARDYASLFTAQELRDSIAFYGSPSGARIVALQPELQKRGRAHGEQAGREAGMEAGRRAMQRMLDELVASEAAPGT